MVAKPPVITAWISDLVIRGRKGLMRSGASVWTNQGRVLHEPTNQRTVFTWPRKMLPAAFMDSQAVVPTVTWTNHSSVL